MHITLFPYAEVDGVRNIPDSVMRELYAEMGDLADLAFYDGSVQDSFSFLEFVKRPGVLTWIVCQDKTPVAIIWFTEFRMTTAYMHYCFFESVSTFSKVKIGREVLRQTLEMKTPGGEYVFETILGLTPADNKGAVKFARAIGMEPVGIIPNGTYNHWLDTKHDGLLSYAVRKENE